MESIIFLIALVSVIYVLIWAIRNEDLDDDEPTRGFFRMTDEQNDADDNPDDPDQSDNSDNPARD